MNKIDYVKMGQRVRTTRKELEMTQMELAEQVGVSASFLGHIERGSRVASIETLVSLCRVLDVSADYLLGLNDIPVSQFFDQDLTTEQREAGVEILNVLKQVIWKL